jgi:formylglycine-generating enzyme required for sulfatase activity
METLKALLVISLTFMLITVAYPGEPKVGVEVVPQGTKGGPMMFIPAGEFMMGCNSEVDKECIEDEKPYHRVYLDDYYMDKHEVTAGDYEKCVNAKSCSKLNSGSICNNGNSRKSNHPINCVNWNQADNFCKWAGKRLPTEAEWEKAARGTDGRIYPWGNEFDCNKSCNSVKPCNHNSTCTAGSIPADMSPFGAMDMGGNVWEWVADWYGAGYFKISPSNNPRGASSGKYRVLRGGSWGVSHPEILRVSYRFWINPTANNWDWGFRCARSGSQ